MQISVASCLATLKTEHKMRILGLGLGDFDGNSGIVPFNEEDSRSGWKDMIVIAWKAGGKRGLFDN